MQLLYLIIITKTLISPFCIGCEEHFEVHLHNEQHFNYLAKQVQDLALLQTEDLAIQLLKNCCSNIELVGFSNNIVMTSFPSIFHCQVVKSRGSIND